MEFTDYLTYLKDLLREMETLTKIQAQKQSAVRAYDLAALNECMKQEQAISLAMRGLEQRRTKLIAALSLEGLSMAQLPKAAPEALRSETRELTEAVLMKHAELRSAQDASRTLMEKELRRIDSTLLSKGIPHEEAQAYSDPSGITMPKGMRTDFRA